MSPLTKDDFVTNDLHRMRERLKKAEKDAAAGEDSVATPTDKPTEEQASSSLKKALNKRVDEFNATRRDLLGRCAETSITLIHRIENSEELIAEAKRFQEFVEKISEEIKHLDLPADAAQSEIADANRTLENARLEFIRGITTMRKYSDPYSEQQSGVTTFSNPEPDILSASKSQLLKMGLMLSMPAIAAFLIGCFIVAIAILIGMGIIR